jgi:hypothetical protein
MKYAVVVVHRIKRDWKEEVAINYTKLCFDYCMASRIDKPDIDFYETDNPGHANLIANKYDYVLLLQAGILFEYSYWEDEVKGIVENNILNGDIKFNKNIAVQRNGNTKVQNMDLNIDFPYVDTTNENTFSKTHMDAMEILVHNSNLSYLIHNEIPNVLKGTVRPLDYAITLSSGFYINYVLDINTFTDDTVIHHIDVSRMSLYARQHMIENWSGGNFLGYLDYMYKEFPMLELFNGTERLHSHHPAAQKCWKHVLETFGEDGWMQHWKKYKNLKHTYDYVNLQNNNKLRSTLNKYDLTGSGAFWWNGALKRMPANVLKSSEQSYTGVQEFLSTLESINPDIIAYGSDHCVTEFNGCTVAEANKKISFNSREKLWKKLYK